MEYFTLDTTPDNSGPAVDDALRRAWNACAGVGCVKCGAAAWQYCRNRSGAGTVVTRFHRPRQDAAGVPAILIPVKIRGLGWAKAKRGGVAWDARRVPTV